MKKTIRTFIYLFLIPMMAACSQPKNIPFDGQSAFSFAETQMNFGERTPGSEGHAQLIDWLTTTLSNYEWDVEQQITSYQNKPVSNIIAKRDAAAQQPWIIIGAHYDTRFFADQDPNLENHRLPVPGANDGASGVAVLLELARVLPENLDKNVWLVFFDAEDQGYIDDWQWIMGSSAFAEQLSEKPEAVVIVDMIGDKDLNIYFEKNSSPELQTEIWNIAATLGYGEVFIPEYKHSILDDHTPFLKKNITAIDIIDFDYPYWHTIDDTLDKISSESLHAVGDTLYHWLLMPENNRK